MACAKCTEEMASHPCWMHAKERATCRAWPDQWSPSRCNICITAAAGITNGPMEHRQQALGAFKSFLQGVSSFVERVSCHTPIMIVHFSKVILIYQVNIQHLTRNHPYVRATLSNNFLSMHFHNCLTNTGSLRFFSQKKRKSSVEPDRLYEEVLGSPRRDTRFCGWFPYKLRVKDLTLSENEAGPFPAMAASSEDLAG